MKKKIPTFSKLAFSVFLTLFALSFILLNGGDTFLETSITEAANSQASIAATRNTERFRNAVGVQNRHTERLKRIPGVVGIGTGIGADGHPVIRIFTRRAGIPGIPESLDGVPVRVKVTGMFIAFNDPTARFDRPVPIGVSTGHPDITAGTIGARVIDTHGNVYALSNNHVYANQNEASIGDSALQPGAYDGGSYPADEIGELFDYEPIDFSLFGSNTMDAAIALTTTNQLGTATLPEGYGTPNSTIFGDLNGDGDFDNENDLLNLPVQKFGRTTGLTHGIVTEINVTTAVCYANCSSQFFAVLAWFDDQISISGINAEAFSLGGDSGSLVVTDDGNNYPVGLLFAGSSTTTLANRIDLVLNHFGVSVDDGSESSNTPPTADFTFSANDLAVSFTDQSSDPDGSIVNWKWNFGDESTSTAQNPTHTYASGGAYLVTLEVTDNEEAIDYIEEEITVSSGSGGITLDATSRIVRGRNLVDLTWEGATSKMVDIFREGSLVKTTKNDGFHTDSIGRNKSGTYAYRVCEVRTLNCSNAVKVTF
jgi:PKD repeat protein